MASRVLAAVPGYTAVMPGWASTNAAGDAGAERGPATSPATMSRSISTLAPPQVSACGPRYWCSRRWWAQSRLGTNGSVSTRCPFQSANQMSLGRA